MPWVTWASSETTILVYSMITIIHRSRSLSNILLYIRCLLIRGIFLHLIGWVHVGTPWTIVYKCEDIQKNWVCKRQHWCRLIRLDSTFRKPQSSPSKETKRSATGCLWRYRFWARVWNSQILKQVVEYQLFTSLWNRGHQRLSIIKLNQMSAFFSFLFQKYPRFTAGNRIGYSTGKQSSSHL
jgi:hypothetical protein